MLCARGADALDAAAADLVAAGKPRASIVTVAADVSTRRRANASSRPPSMPSARIDILVNNVGKAGGGDIVSTLDAEWQGAHRSDALSGDSHVASRRAAHAARTAAASS